MKRINFITIVILLYFPCHCYCQALKDSSVDILAHWQAGETHTFKLKSTTKEYVDAAQQNATSLFTIKFKIKEHTDSGYLAEWVYTDVILDAKDPVIENRFIACMLNTKMVLSISDAGRFEKLINAEEIKAVANKAVDSLLTVYKSDKQLNAEYPTIKQFILSAQGIEILLLKPLKAYTYFFGYNYILHAEDVSKASFPNPLDGAMIEAEEKVVLKELDKKKSTLRIESEKSSNIEALKKVIIAYFKKFSKGDEQEIERQVGKRHIEMSENMQQDIDFEKGLVLKYNFTRSIMMGFQNEISSTEMVMIN